MRMTQLLIHLGCDVNAKDMKGRSPLFYAFKAGYTQICVVLIANNSSCFSQDSDGVDLYSVSSNIAMRQLLNKGKLYQVVSRFTNTGTQGAARVGISSD